MQSIDEDVELSRSNSVSSGSADIIRHQPKAKIVIHNNPQPADSLKIHNR